MSGDARVPAILVVVGASGAGKTTLVRQLDQRGLSGVGCYYFDTIGVSSSEEIVARFGDGLRFQEWALDQWLDRLTRNEDGVELAILDAQLRPSSVREGMRRREIKRWSVVLVDCGHQERHARLRNDRQQPELATPLMDTWAAYLRGQADALGLDIVDTTNKGIDGSVIQLRDVITRFLKDTGIGGVAR